MMVQDTQLNMAIDTGKKTVQLKPSAGDSIGIPQVNDKNYITESIKPITEITDTYLELAALNHGATFKNDFYKKTGETYREFKKLHKNNPEQMKAVTDAYTKSTVDNTPLVYKEFAVNILANNNMAAMNLATVNRTRLDNEMLLDGSNESLKDGQGLYSENLSNIADSDLEPGNKITEINNIYMTSEMYQLNEKLGDRKKHLLDTELESQSDYIKKVEDEILNADIERLFAIMKSVDSDDALTILDSFAKGKDLYPPEFGSNVQEDDLNNAMFQDRNKWLKDSDNREKIVDGALSKYRKWNNENLSNNTKNSMPWEVYKEQGNFLFPGALKHGVITDVHTKVMEIPNMEINSKEYWEATDYVQEIKDIQAKISKKLASSNKHPVDLNFKNAKEETLFADTLLKNYNITNADVIADVNNPIGNLVANILKTENILPTIVTDRLNKNIIASYDADGIIEGFQADLRLAKFFSSDNMFPGLGMSDEMKFGLANGVENADKFKAIEIMKAFKNKDMEATILNFTEQYSNDPERWHFTGGIGLDAAIIAGPMPYLDHKLDSLEAASDANWFWKFMPGAEENIYTKHLLKADDSTTFGWHDASDIVPIHAKAKITEMLINELAIIAPNMNIDIWDKSNNALMNKAWERTKQKLLNENWRITTHTSDGQPKMQKNSYESVFGNLDSNDVYASINADFSALSNDEKISKWGSTDDNVWKDVFKKWADNDQGDNTRFNNDNIHMEIKPTGNNYKGLPEFKLTVWKDNEFITIEDSFYPNGWDNITNENAPTSHGQIVHNATKETYEKFLKFTEKHGIDLPDDKAHWIKRGMFGLIKMGYNLSDWRFYPDWPLLNDVPAEIRPFALLMKMAGVDIDIRKVQTDLMEVNKVAVDHLSLNEKIKKNINLSNAEKNTEAIYSPADTPFSNSIMSLSFKNFALENYKDTSQALTYRTNNWAAVSSADWDGEIDVKYKRDSRKFAVFAHPKNSIRAAVKSILNHSSLTAKLNNIDKRFSDHPTYEEIFTMYAEDTASYLTALTTHTNFKPSDTVDLLDKNALHSLLKLITQHEMGFETYKNKNFNSNFVDAVIMEGINLAIQSYEGRLGEL